MFTNRPNLNKLLYWVIIGDIGGLGSMCASFISLTNNTNKEKDIEIKLGDWCGLTK